MDEVDDGWELPQQEGENTIIAKDSEQKPRMATTGTSIISKEKMCFDCFDDDEKFLVFCWKIKSALISPAGAHAENGNRTRRIVVMLFEGRRFNRFARLRVEIRWKAYTNSISFDSILKHFLSFLTKTS